MKTLVVYLMAGRETPALAEAAVQGGADIVEIGFPFSDPLADGPVIRRAAERALAEGMRTAACLECLAAVRERIDDADRADDVRVAARGVRLRALRARTHRPQARPASSSPTYPSTRTPSYVAFSWSRRPRPTSGCELAPRRTDGWLYLVSVTGTTGARESLSVEADELVGRAREIARVPLYLGFGISTPDHAVAAARIADGVVVGSRAVEIAQEGPEALLEYVASLREALDRV